jgi:IS5 family transposase
MATDDFFRARLDQMIDLRHPLAVLASRMPWPQIEASLAPVFAHRDRKGRLSEGADMFGPTLAVAGAGISNAGRPRLPIRLMVALLYLKHAYNESDESLVERWAQDVYFQFFSGQVYFEPRLPCDPAQISRFRRVLGEAGVEQLLKTTIEAAVDMGAVKKTEFERVIVDTTVQEKAIAHPTDSRLLEVSREKVTRLAKRAGIQLKQTHEREGKTLRRRAGGYAHAKQFKRLRTVLKRQRTILGRLLREVRRKMGGLADEARTELDTWVQRAAGIHRQWPEDKNKPEIRLTHGRSDTPVLSAPPGAEGFRLSGPERRQLLGDGILQRPDRRHDRPRVVDVGRLLAHRGFQFQTQATEAVRSHRPCG